MDRLKLALAAMLLALAAPGLAADDPRWAPFVAEASSRFGIPERWIWRVMAAESGGRTWLDGRPITSRAGAMGLMQLMPGTWREVRTRLRLGPDPHDPRDNILAGTWYLAEMHARFGYPGMFAAYNAGPARYARHLAAGAPLPDETLAYLATVAPEVAGRGALAAGDPADAGPPVAARPSGGSPPRMRGGDIFFPLRPGQAGRAPQSGDGAASLGPWPAKRRGEADSP